MSRLKAKFTSLSQLYMITQVYTAVIFPFSIHFLSCVSGIFCCAKDCCQGMTVCFTDLLSGTPISIESLITSVILSMIPYAIISMILSIILSMIIFVILSASNSVIQTPISLTSGILALVFGEVCG